MLCLAEDGFFVSTCVNNIRNAIFCMCCLVILGPLLFIVGISLLVTSPTNNTRDNNVSDMNGVISDWNNQNRAVFAEMNFYVITANGTVALDKTLPDESDELPDTDGVHSYQPLYYQAEISELFATQIYTTTDETMHVIINGSALNHTLDVSVPIFYTNSTSDDPQYCGNNGGEFRQSDGTCYYYTQLTSLCIQVDNTGALASRRGGNGCEGPNFDPFYYDKLQYNNGQVLIQEIPFFGNTVTIRSSNDPYIEAEDLTSGSLSFGLSKGQIAVLGLGLMIVGIIFMLPCCFMAFMLIYFTQKRRR